MTHRTNEELIEIARQVAACAAGWEPEARLIGNVRAIDLLELATSFIVTMRERDDLRCQLDDLIQSHSEELDYRD